MSCRDTWQARASALDAQLAEARRLLSKCQSSGQALEGKLLTERSNTTKLKKELSEACASR